MPYPMVVSATPPRTDSVHATFSCSRSPGRLGAVWFHLTGELDLSCVDLMAEQLREAQASAFLVAVDLRELEFIDCAGLRVLIGAEAEARRSSKSLVLIRGGGQVDRMLEVGGLLEWFEVVDVRAAEAA